MDEKPVTTEPMKPRRRWFRFSLRALLIFVMLAGCGFAWLGIKIQEARQQQAIVALVRGLGGWVVFDDDVDSHGVPVFSAKRSGALSLIVALVGEDLFKTVVEISLPNAPITDAGLEHLKGLARLKKLNLRGTHVTEIGVARLQDALPNCEIEAFPDFEILRTLQFFHS